MLFTFMYYVIKNMLDSLNFNNINYLGITYVFQKTNSKSFNYFYQYNYDKDQEKNFMI